MTSRARTVLPCMLSLSVACNGDPDPDPPAFSIAFETDDGALLSAWARAADDAWAVGGQPRAGVDTPGSGLLVHFDGVEWIRAQLPADTPMLNWVFGFDDSMWVVGEDGVALRHAAGEWVAHDTGTPLALWGVWGPADDDLWAVGGDPFGDTPVVVRWDGATWTETTLPALDRASAAMFKVWGTATDDVWIVGDAGVVLHWDGAALEQVLAGTGADLISVWGTGPDDVLAVGGRSTATITRWDGTSWTATVVGEISGLNGVWMNADGDATVVGNLGALGTVAAGTLEIDSIDAKAGTNVLHGVFGFDDGTRFVVGGTLLQPPPWSGLIVQRPADG